MPFNESIVFAAIVFALAGWVKGVVGMGLPTVAMGALAMVMAPVQAAALLVVPSLVTNIWQFAAGSAKRLVFRRLASMLVFVCIGTAVGIQFLTSASRWPSLALGGVLAAYALIGLQRPTLQIAPRHESRLSPIVGGLTGLLTGATGVFVVPAVPYLSALGFGKDELVQALGLSFTVSTIALAVGLAANSSYPSDILLASLAAVVPALLGMFIGQRTRARIDPISFKRWFFISMLLIGIYMVARGLISM
jgi:uncharacterized protein